MTSIFSLCVIINTSRQKKISTHNDENTSHNNVATVHYDKTTKHQDKT